MKRVSHVLQPRRLLAQYRVPSRCYPSLRRFIHNSESAGNKPIEPILKESSEPDQFSAMMDDRTNALLQSLGLDAKNFENLEKKHLEGEKTVANSVSLMAAVDVNARPPSINATPPLHFFDTQDVYSELRSAGLTPGQAEVVMRTMQDLIHELVQTCRDTSVPISAAANEAYLFDAASSEVRNEISNSRQAQATTYRSGLSRLQRDVEILEHEANEMTSLLKSDLDIEVHERKNATRAEENMIQLKIQDLNNKISTRLNSELKSEIENLRWQITRRSLAAIGVIVAMFIWLTQTNSRTTKAKTQERQRNSAGTSVPVPVLAPSMSSSDDPYDHASSSVQVEDLSAYPSPQSGVIPSNNEFSLSASSSDKEKEAKVVESPTEESTNADVQAAHVGSDSSKPES